MFVELCSFLSSKSYKCMYNMYMYECLFSYNLTRYTRMKSSEKLKYVSISFCLKGIRVHRFEIPMLFATHDNNFHCAW